VPEHVWVHPRQADAGNGRELTKSACGGMPVHAHPAPVQQERSARTLSCRTVDSAADGGQQRDQDDLAALAAHP